MIDPQKAQRLAKVLTPDGTGIASELDSIEEKVDKVKETTDQLEADLTVVSEAQNSLLNEVKQQSNDIDQLREEKLSKSDFERFKPKDGKDGKTIVGPKGDKGEDGKSVDEIAVVKNIKENLPDFGNVFRDGLELLEGEERLDVSAIKGLDDYATTYQMARRPFNSGGGLARGVADDLYYPLSSNPSGYAHINQTTDPDTFVGTFTFPNLQVSGDTNLLKPDWISVSNSAIFPNNLKQAHGTVQVNNKFYVGLRSLGSIIVYNDPDDLTDTTVLTIPGGHVGVESMIYDGVTSRIYFTITGVATSPVSARIGTLNPADNSITVSDALGTWGGSPAITSDGTYIYAVTYTSPATFVKVEIATMTVDSSATWTGRTNGHAIVRATYTPTGEVDPIVRLIATNAETDTYLAIVDPSDLTYTETALPAVPLATDDLIAYDASDGVVHVLVGSELKNRAEVIDLSTGEMTDFYAPMAYGWGTIGTSMYALGKNGHIAEYFLPTLVAGPSGGNVTGSWYKTDYSPNEFFSSGGKIFFTDWNDSSGTMVEFTLPDSVSIGDINETIYTQAVYGRTLQVADSLTLSSLVSGLLKTDSNGLASIATAGVDYENPLTFSYPLTRATDTIGLGYNTTNLKLTSNELDTIQGISTSASPTFGGLTLNRTDQVALFNSARTLSTRLTGTASTFGDTLSWTGQAGGVISYYGVAMSYSDERTVQNTVNGSDTVIGLRVNAGRTSGFSYGNMTFAASPTQLALENILSDSGNYNNKTSNTTITSTNNKQASTIAPTININTSVSISSFADAGSGQVTVTTSASHNATNGSTVVITGTTNYNGTYTVSNITSNTYRITVAWAGNDATGTSVTQRTATHNVYVNDTVLSGSPTLPSGTYNLNHIAYRVTGTGITAGTTVGASYYTSLTGYDTTYGFWNDSATDNWLGLDNSKTYFGTAKDASIYYDNTNLVINPKEVGTGILDLQGGLSVDSITNDTGLAAGTYTPTLTNVTNIDASTAYQAQYMRVGNTVTVSGKVDIDNASAGDWELGVSLPIASNLGAEEDLAGTGVGVNSPTGAAIYIKADATNDRASLNGSDTDVSNHAHYFHFTYQVI